ncbi:xanthine dehydrogenase FAD-binding subunit [Peptoniphilus asaccharolyticus DSM 20463]|uniref:Xanthine dehydrogenase FAD-binding subunit n=1 Tax=Peptoniphilus asaccharolyticus DSM 20463 TaxID=573058 RepID=A0A1W1UH99_PEPAS|nr:xanthine dehydrogenase subunit XdhB [Peptoniphilus asaccharolyticus]MBL7574721.1 xanthine dehydrogenase FAD-binding subunit XdhB [Peptoniphilus asaccharolyticus]SMB80447.1 xanthine dehydrogenase FAD-binding subunit [Peptoniphilus asaccharolyticus DSM 20463]
MYDIKKIYEAFTVDEAIELLREHPEAKILGGGSDVLIKIREGKMAGEELVSIYMIDEIRGISMDEDETLRIGALTSFSHITQNELIQKYCPTLGEAVDTAGGPQLRNIATIGGNISNGVPSADSTTTLHAWDAIVEIKGENGVREVPITEFYIKTGVVDLKPTELVTALKIKKESYEGYYGHYFKYAMRNAMDIATSGCSISCKFSGENIVEDVRTAFGVAGPIPLRTPEAEKFLKGKPLTAENINAFAEEAIKELKPRDSWRASKDLRVHILKEISRRSLVECLKAYKGGQNA